MLLTFEEEEEKKKLVIIAGDNSSCFNNVCKMNTLKLCWISGKKIQRRESIKRLSLIIRAAMLLWLF